MGPPTRFTPNKYEPCALYGSRRAPTAAALVVAGPMPPSPAPAPGVSRELDRLCRVLPRDLVQAFVEPPGIRLLSLGQRLEPLRQLRQPLVPRGLGHAGVHLRVLVGLTGHGGLEVQLGLADRLAGGGIADFFEEVEMTERVTGLGVGRVLEQARHVREALDVRDAREVEIAAVGLRLAGKSVLQVVEALSPLEASPWHSSSFDLGWSHGDRCRSGRRTRCAGRGLRSPGGTRPGVRRAARQAAARRRCARTPRR